MARAALADQNFRVLAELHRIRPILQGHLAHETPRIRRLAALQIKDNDALASRLLAERHRAITSAGRPWEDCQ